MEFTFRFMENRHQAFTVEYILMVQILQEPQCPRWVGEHHCCPWVPVNSIFATMASSSALCSTSASTKPSHNGPSCSMDLSPTSSMPSMSQTPRTSLHHLHLHGRTPEHRDRHHHPRRQELPIARVCFALGLCDAKFQAHRYWQAKWHCHRPLRSVQHRDVKGFIYVKKIPVFQGCVCIPMTWQVAERETAHLWAKISGRTWTRAPSAKSMGLPTFDSPEAVRLFLTASLHL